MSASLRTIFAVLLLSASCNIFSMDIDKYHSGSWWNPSQSGHGFSIEVLNEDLVVIYWYVFNPDGTSTFLLSVGQIDGNQATGTTYYYSGMRFGEFDPASLQEDIWGTITITFHGCNSATLQYSSTMSHQGTPFGAGTVPLQRLLSIQGTHCLENPLAGNYHITSVAQEGIGFGFGVVFENGAAAYFAMSDSEAEVGLGEIIETGPTSFGMDFFAYDVFGGATAFSGNGEFSEDGLTGNLDDGSLFLGSRLYSFQHKLAAQKLAGTYTITDVVFQVYAGTATIAANGEVSGSTADGCSLSGSAIVPNQNINQVFVDVSLADCATPNRILGAATYDFAEDSILVFGADGDYGYVWELSR